MKIAIKIDSKPLEKLIDVVSSGIGKLYEATEIRRRADAKAHEIEVLSRANTLASIKGRELEQDFVARTAERVAFQDLKRQKNIENTIFVAAEQLKQEKSVSDEPVDEYWTTRFFRIVEDVSEKEIQILWGRILASEIKNPSSYSLRTLELLKNLSKKEAECFMKFGKVAISMPRTSFLLYYHNISNGLNKIDEFGVTYQDEMMMMEAGLLSYKPSSQTFPEPVVGEYFPLLVGIPSSTRR